MLDNLQNLVNNWTQRRFLLDSGYYAGRAPTTSDLNSQILESIYDGLKSEAGGKDATNFVRFVNNLDDLSASSFIVAFEQFCANDCKIVAIKQRKEDRTRITGYGDEAEMQAFAVIAEALSGRRRSDDEIKRLSDGIKYEFIRKHHKEIPAKEQREIRSTFYR